MVTLFLGDKDSDYYMPGTTEELAKHIVKVSHRFNIILIKNKLPCLLLSW